METIVCSKSNGDERDHQGANHSLYIYSLNPPHQAKTYIITVRPGPPFRHHLKKIFRFVLSHASRGAATHEGTPNDFGHLTSGLDDGRPTSARRTSGNGALGGMTCVVWSLDQHTAEEMRSALHQKLKYHGGNSAGPTLDVSGEKQKVG